MSVGVDIGGTKIAAAVVTPSGVVLARRRTDTPGRDTSPDVVERAIGDVVQQLCRDHPVRAVGVAAAGFVDEQRTKVLFAPHLSWRSEPLRESLQRRTRMPVVVENDANAAAWAEMRLGAGREATGPAVMVNLGTGIGGALVIGGEVYRGRHGLAGEFGHMTVVPEGRLCECGNRGCWEQYASGNALVRAARELMRREGSRALDRVAAGDPEALQGPMVTRLARDGDADCLRLCEQVGHWLGVGLANLAAGLDPELFLIGGGVSEAGEVLLEPARRAFTRHLTGRGFRPQARVVAARLGNSAGMIGAALLAREAVGIAARARVRSAVPRGARGVRRGAPPARPR